MTRPNVAPCRPPTAPPMRMTRPPSPASRTAVLRPFFICGERYCRPLGSLRSELVVPGVDVDARDALGVEHVDVAAVVVEGELGLEALGAQLGDRHALGVGRRAV